MTRLQEVESNVHRAMYIGTAGWTVPQEHAAHFSQVGTHLQRYAACFSGVEINSSFYKAHRPATYARWAALVPAGFRFAVKLPKEITHARKLIETKGPLENFLKEVSALDAKLGPLLVQLPPSLGFQVEVAHAFFAALRVHFSGSVVCEPRHASWFTEKAERVLVDFQVARAAADPAPVPAAAQPGGWQGMGYYRLHGSPRMYYSGYTDDALQTLVQSLRGSLRSAPVWCIFDNTAFGEATGDALNVSKQLQNV